MRKLLLLLLLIFSVSIYAKKTKEADLAAIKERERLIANIDKTLQRETVLGKLAGYAKDISKGEKNGKPLHAVKYTVIVSSINSWLEYRWFIADTGLSRKWLKSVHALFDYLAKNKRLLDAAKFNGRLNTPKAKLALKYREQAYNSLIKLLEKPVKVSNKVHRKAKLNKVLWQKEMRKKYKIKENTSTAEF